MSLGNIMVALFSLLLVGVGRSRLGRMNAPPIFVAQPSLFIYSFTYLAKKKKKMSTYYVLGLTMESD